MIRMTDGALHCRNDDCAAAAVGNRVDRGMDVFALIVAAENDPTVS